MSPFLTISARRIDQKKKKKKKDWPVTYIRIYYLVVKVKVLESIFAQSSICTSMGIIWKEEWAVGDVASDCEWVVFFVTPWTIQSMKFSRPEYWSGYFFPFPRGSSQPRDWTHVSRIAGKFFTSWATREVIGWCKGGTFIDRTEWGALFSLLKRWRKMIWRKRHLDWRMNEVGKANGLEELCLW